MTTSGPRPTLAVWKFASCDGCQLSLLDCEDELLAVADRVQIAYFLEASRAVVEGPYDLSLVEGSVTTLMMSNGSRRSGEPLVAWSRSAPAPPPAASRRCETLPPSSDYVGTVYATPSYISTLATSTPISAHVPVDFELHGCPIDRRQLLEVIGAFLVERRPNVPGHSVCVECKLRGNVCVMVAGGNACLGPITRAGCGAICPSYGRGCYGCFGPAEDPNPESLSEQFARLGVARLDLVRMLRTFNTEAAPFRDESARLTAEESSR